MNPMFADYYISEEVMMTLTRLIDRYQNRCDQIGFVGCWYNLLSCDQVERYGIVERQLLVSFDQFRHLASAEVLPIGYHVKGLKEQYLPGVF